jgi:hypothetical protein
MIGPREFITLLGGATAGWPLTVRGQQPAMPVVGYLSSVSPEPEIVAAFRRDLGESGFPLKRIGRKGLFGCSSRSPDV